MALTFGELVKRPFPNLPHAALLLAKELAYPELAVEAYLHQLDDLADEAARCVRPHDNTAVRAELLSEFLFKQQGFQGNAAAYDDPRNSYLNDVLDRRLGIPITLSIVYLTIAERLQIPAYGVGLPGHFIVGVEARAETLYFDPFHGGGRLSAADCARLVEVTIGHKGAFLPDWLSFVSSKEILSRMLNNLRLLFLQRQEWQQSLAVVQRMLQVQPGDHHHLREMGVIYYQLGNIHQAATFLEAYLQQEPEAADAETIRQGLSEALDAWVKKN